MTLELYEQKRDFARTTEPKPRLVDDTTSHRFVVQEHHASRLHYDFRLEMDGVLKSWAVPKGPPPTSGIRRLAVMTEDHPIEYLTFSGTIPVGNYGAGEMAIWDSGTYESLADADPVHGVERGKLELQIHGEQLNGKYDLIRTDDEKNNWIFIKAKDQELKRRSQPVAPKSETAEFKLPVGSRKSAMSDPADVEPMLAVAKDEPFDDPRWQFELKWDGYRALTFITEQQAKIYSRNHHPFTEKSRLLSNLAQYFRCDDAVIDGEVLVLERDGRPNFHKLQNTFGFGPRRGERLKTTSEKDDGSQLVYMAFDLLYYDGHDLTGCRLDDRRRILKQIIVPDGPVRYSDEFAEFGTKLFKHLKQAGVEGMMAKLSGSSYVPTRSSNWVKIKNLKSADVIIAGYTESKAERRPFASLIVGQYDGESLVSLGHVGTGFDHQTGTELLSLMKKREVKKSPFAVTPIVNGAAHWLKPEIACEITFTDVTNDGQLRHSVYLHLRPDKSAKDCTLTVVRQTEKPPTTTVDAVPEASGQDNIPELKSTSLVEESQLNLGSQTVHVTHLSKVYWPETGTTKRDLLEYYRAVAPVLLPHLQDRPMVVQRYPNGVAAEGFFQHDILAGSRGSKRIVPEFLKIFEIEESSGVVHYAICNNLESLLYLGNLGTIPIHLWNVTVGYPEQPDRIVFDFDPPSDLAPAIQGVHTLKAVLDTVGLRSYPKSSGANGIHVYVPIEPLYGSDVVSSFAKMIGQAAVKSASNVITTERRIKNRSERKVYLDCVQNGVGKTVVAPYSVRAQTTPLVSAPLNWSEVDENLDLHRFTTETVIDRIEAQGDLFASVLTAPQRLGSAVSRLIDLRLIPTSQGEQLLNQISDAETSTGARGKT